MHVLYSSFLRTRRLLIRNRISPCFKIVYGALVFCLMVGVFLLFFFSPSLCCQNPWEFCVMLTVLLALITAGSEVSFEFWGVSEADSHPITSNSGYVTWNIKIYCRTVKIEKVEMESKLNEFWQKMIDLNQSYFRHFCGLFFCLEFVEYRFMW